MKKLINKILVMQHQKLLSYFLFLVILFLLYKISLYFIDILIIYFLMLFFAIIIKPIVDKIEKNTKISKELSILLIITLFFATLITLIFILIPNIYNSISEIAKNLQENIKLTLTSLTNFISNKLPFIQFSINYNQIYQNIIEQINRNIPQITEKAIQIIFSSGKIIFKIILIAVLTFYMIKDYEKIIEYKTKVLSKIFNIPIENIRELVSEIENIIRKFLLGQIFAATYIFIFTLITLFLFNIKQYFLIALIAAIFELIPFIGAFISFSISIIFILNKGILNVIIFILIATIAYQILAKIIYPNVVGKILNISVITVLISIMVGFKLYGIFGMFIAVPIVSIIKYFLDKYLIKQTN